MNTILSGDSNANTLTGNTGNDLLFGNDNNDSLSGGAAMTCWLAVLATTLLDGGAG